MPHGADGIDYYEVLNVGQNASNLEIREAYVRMKQTYDSQNQALYSLCSDEDATEMRSQIEAAYSILQNETTRAEYDRARLAPNDQQKAQGGENDEKLSASELGYKAVSTLQPVKARKIHAPGSNDDDLQRKMADIIAAGDPSDGGLLRELREVMGVSELQMHESTKIGIDQIRALESNAYDRLPKEIFIKGFLRSYLKYLLIPDIEVLVSAFIERLKSSREPQSDI